MTHLREKCTNAKRSIMWALQQVRKDYHEGAISKRDRNDNLLDNMVQCVKYINEIRMVISKLSENERDIYYENSIEILKLLNKDLSTFFNKSETAVMKKCLEFRESISELLPHRFNEDLTVRVISWTF